jgi:hypothetical protein
VKEYPRVSEIQLIIFLHTKTSITKRILTLDAPKRRGRFSDLFEGRAKRNKGWESSHGSERCRGGTKKLVSCRGRNLFADKQTVMEGDDRRTSVDGYVCGGEGGATGRFVSWLWAEIQPSEDGVGMIVMVDDRSEKITSAWAAWCVPPPLASSFVDFEKTLKTFFRLGASS